MRVHSRLTRELVRALAGLTLALALAAGLADAQATDSLPPAPQPQPQPVQQLAPDAPIVAMFPHPEDSRYWLSGQANIIFQGRLPFHSLYQGANSFRNSAEY